MEPSFNINRPPVSDDEIEKHKNFDALVAQFKKQSLKKARGDESWWKKKSVQYSTVILGVTVVCTVTYQSIQNQNRTQTALKSTNESITTPHTPNTKTKRSRPYVAPKISSINKKKTAYKVNNQKGARIEHTGSTKIDVPKGAFVDAAGAEIIGEVTLEYREFDHLPDIIGAGIPMRHDSAGKTYHLESAGMFEIAANKDGVPVSLKKDLPISVDLASYNKEDRFYQYYLDTVNRNWRYLGADKPVIERSSSLPSSVRAPEIDQTQLTRRTDSVTGRYNAALAKLPSPKKPHQPQKHRAGRPTFVLESSYQEFPELAAFKNVIFEVGPENENYDPALHEVTWSDIKISEGPVKGKNYILHLSYRSRHVKLLVYPVLKGSDYENARAEYEDRMADYNSKLRERNENEERLKAELERKKAELAAAAKRDAAERIAKLTNESRASTRNQMSASVQARRLFQVTNFGIYNSDHPHQLETRSALQPQFVDSETSQSIEPETIYVIDHRRKTVITANDPSRLELPATQTSDYSMCAVRGEDIYTCDKNTLRTVLNAGRTTFPLRKISGGVANMKDFRKTLEL